ncbi:glycosyltransferase family 4 protein [Paenibacillus sp. MBLB4367]|uniref:glycosyltransferase family 4 protein n=1 Tax=Paenibacillus sp. MBLB4367 TaxID=3384767 RepID=UPI003907FF2A
MKTILIVTTVQATISAFLVPHIRRLQEQGFDVHVATCISDLPKFSELLGGVTIFHIPFSRGLLSFSNLVAVKKIRKLFNTYHYDAVHVHTPIASFITRMVAYRTCKVYYTAHGFHFNEQGKGLSNLIYFLSEKVAGYRTDKLIVINSDDYQAAHKLVHKNKVLYIKGIGVDMRRFDLKEYSHSRRDQVKKELGIARDTVVITHLAEFTANKRHIDVIEACERLKQKYTDFVILLAGQGHHQEMVKKEIALRHLESHVKCLGYRSDIDDILSITDIGLLVSLREGLPRSVMEMMSMAIPVVLTDIRGNRDLVVHGENGFLVPVMQPEKIADSCLALIQDPALRHEMGALSRKKIEQEYELDKILGEHDAIYKELLHG